MMERTLFLMLAVLVFAGCSKDNDINKVDTQMWCAAGKNYANNEISCEFMLFPEGDYKTSTYLVPASSAVGLQKKDAIMDSLRHNKAILANGDIVRSLYHTFFYDQYKKHEFNKILIKPGKYFAVCYPFLEELFEINMQYKATHVEVKDGKVLVLQPIFYPNSSKYGCIEWNE